MYDCSFVVSKCWPWRGFTRVIVLSIVPNSCLLFNVLCVRGLLFIVLGVPYVFVVRSLPVTSLAYTRKVTYVAFQLVNTGFVVWWGSSSVCCYD